MSLLNKFDSSVMSLKVSSLNDQVYRLGTYGGISSNDLMVQFGVKDFGGDYALLASTKGDDGDAEWFNSYDEALAAGTGPVSMVRVVPKAGVNFNLSDGYTLALNLVGTSTVEGTRLPTWLACKATEVDGGDWRLYGYNPVTMDNVEGGKQLKITPSFTTAPGVGDTGVYHDVTIIGTILNEMTYVDGSASIDPESVVVKGDEEGTFETEENEVIYYYSRIIEVNPTPIPLGTTEKGSIIVKHVDDKTNKTLCSVERYTGVINSDYETSSKSFEGYLLIQTPDNQNGKYAKEEAEVVYRYSYIGDVELPKGTLKLPQTGDNGMEQKMMLAGFILLMSGIVLRRKYSL